MGQTLTTWTTRVRAILGNPSLSAISDADVQSAVSAAVQRHGLEMPRVTYADYAGNGSTYLLAIPGSFIAGVSHVEAIEYPQGERPPAWMDDQGWELYPEDSSPTHVMLRDTTPQTGKTARVFYTVTWPIPTATAGDDKIPDVGFEPVARLAAHGAALQLMARAAGNKTASLPSADATNWLDEEARWRDVAKECLSFYLAYLGGGEDSGGGTAEGWVDWDSRASWQSTTGTGFLFRRPRR